ncbi:NlpC/P60 family protein [Collinsella tanakaei]|uniref:C40 family peptidase n=1 Tax=Collinsella tanakaei TaxID=626935 RepID=UPI0022E26026|nr:C40 family peptidase [Collinsella tanakaei]
MMLKRTRAAVTVATAFALAACTIPAQPAYAEPSDQLQQRVNDAYAQLMSYTQELELAGNKLQEVKTNLSNVQTEIEATKTEISEKEAELKVAQEELSGRLSDSYKRGDASLLSVILGANDFSELFSRMFYANKIAERDQQAIDAVRAAKSELESKQEDLAKQEAEQKQLVADQQQQTDAVAARVNAQQNFYSGLDSQLKEQLAEEEALRIAQEEYAKQQAAQQQQQGGNAGGSNNGSNSGNAGNNGGNTSGGGNQGGQQPSQPETPSTPQTPSKPETPSKPSKPSKPSTPDYGSDSGNAPSSVVDVALAQVGKEYVYGTAGPNTFDCSGLVSYSYAQVGYSITHWSQGQFNLVQSKGHLVRSASSLKPGDLVFWGYSASSIYHVGIYIGGGRYVHASMPGVGVVTATLNTGSSTYMGGGSPV